MDAKFIRQIEEPYLKKKIPNIEVGDIIEATTIIRDNEGKKLRTQPYKGLIIAKKGNGTRATITVRKISHGVGVEKIFPVHSPNVEEIKILKKGDSKKAKLYYMRKRIGKAAMKVREGDSSKIDEMITLVEEGEIAEELIESDKQLEESEKAKDSSENNNEIKNETETETKEDKKEINQDDATKDEEDKKDKKETQDKEKKE